MPGLHSFPRRERLTRSRDYQQIYRDGQRISGRGFVCYVARQEGQGRKLGLAVSRKVGGAVVRNRIKRYVREFYRTRRPHLSPDLSVVVVARSEAAGMDYGQCAQALKQLFERGGLLDTGGTPHA